MFSIDFHIFCAAVPFQVVHSQPAETTSWLPCHGATDRLYDGVVVRPCTQHDMLQSWRSWKLLERMSTCLSFFNQVESDTSWYSRIEQDKIKGHWRKKTTFNLCGTLAANKISFLNEQKLVHVITYRFTYTFPETVFQNSRVRSWKTGKSLRSSLASHLWMPGQLWYARRAEITEF